MLLLFLTLVLVAPYGLLTLAGRLSPRAHLPRRVRAKAGLTLLLLVTGSAHFAQTAAMASMLPPWVPYRVPIVHVTGVFELMGAIGIWVPAVARLTGLCLIVMLIGILPANVYAALNRLPFGGHDAGPAYLLVRVPFQLLLIGWVYFATDAKRALEGVSAGLGGRRRSSASTGSITV